MKNTMKDASLTRCVFEEGPPLAMQCFPAVRCAHCVESTLCIVGIVCMWSPHFWGTKVQSLPPSLDSLSMHAPHHHHHLRSHHHHNHRHHTHQWELFCPTRSHITKRIGRTGSLDKLGHLFGVSKAPNTRVYVASSELCELFCSTLPL